ncbi:MAG: adenylate/guanylate cyclase domain-containing protein [Nitrospirae bacterium]|nr:adenylate/guanylate cyclase domain-containing protein [Nitrospirota bacterium]
MKKTRLLSLIAIVSTTIFIALQWLDPAVIHEKIESKTYDLRLIMRNHFKTQSALTDIVIVAIDDKSIKEIGRWPWGRDVQAGLVSKISRGGPKVIGIDIMYTEPDNKEADGKLAQAFEKAGNIVLATPFFVPPGKRFNLTIGETPDFLWDTAFMQVNSPRWIKWKPLSIQAESVNPPIEVLAKSATLGNVFTQPDRDGVIRWEPMYLLYGDDCYPQFGLQIARIARGIQMKDMVLYPAAAVKLGDTTIKTNINGRVLINYVGEANSFHYKSASDVMNDRIPSGFFKDKIVLIGTSALATYDQKVTPLSADLPGVEKNATIVQNILLNNFLTPSPKIIEVFAIIFSGILLGLLVPRLRALKGSVLAAGLIIFYLFLSYFLLLYHGLWINLLYPVTNMFGIFTLQTVVMFVFEEKKAKEIRRMFSSYVSPKIVEILINDPEKAGIGGMRRETTVLFSDIRGFTSISEKYSPEEVVAILNEYLGEMTEIVFKWDGTLDKFIGDAILAFWGAPLIQENHAELAVKCALNMSARLDELQKKWKAEGKPRLDIGIGINTGEVTVGNIGAIGKKMDYTVIGDHVNLGSRVESLTKKYNARILITEYTLGKIRSSFEGGAIGHASVLGKERVIVKGKEKPVGIYELITADHNTESKIVECEDRIVELKEK